MKGLKSTSIIQNGIKPYVIGRIHSYISIMTGYPYLGMNDIEFSTDIIYSDYSIRRVVCHFHTRRIPVNFRHLIDRIQYGDNANSVNVTCVLTGNAIPMMTIKLKQESYNLRLAVKYAQYESRLANPTSQDTIEDIPYHSRLPVIDDNDISNNCINWSK